MRRRRQWPEAIRGLGAVVARAGQLVARTSSTDVTDRDPLAYDGLTLAVEAASRHLDMIVELDLPVPLLPPALQAAEGRRCKALLAELRRGPPRMRG